MDKKTGWRLFSAMREFQPTLRAEGHQGIAINHVVCDRAQISVLDRHHREMHTLEHQTMATQGGPDSAVVFLNLKNWCVSSGCSCHDAHNSLKWALSTYIGDTEFMKTIFVTVDSLTNSYCHLLQGLGPWLSSAVVFKEPPFSSEVLQLVWSVLGLEPAVIEELVDLRVLYHDGHLHVAPRYASDPDLTSRLSTCLLGVFHFQKYSDSRWLSLGPSMRTVVGSVLLGLDSLVAAVFSRDASSQYYLSGYKRWGQSAREFSVICAVSSWVGDSYLAEALSDDRLGRQWQVLYDSIADETMYIGTLPQECYQLLASVAGLDVGELTHRILKATHTSAAYIWHKSLKAASEYPWRLCQGNIREQLLHLKSLPEPSEATTRKIHRLCELGISLLADCPWSSSVCELRPDHFCTWLVACSCLRRRTSRLTSSRPSTRSSLRRRSRPLGVSRCSSRTFLHASRRNGRDRAATSRKQLDYLCRGIMPSTPCSVQFRNACMKPEQNNSKRLGCRRGWRPLPRPKPLGRSLCTGSRFRVFFL